MLSPLKPLLCRHEFYWSERHRADRCRRCGKIRTADIEVARETSLRIEGDRTSSGVDRLARPITDAVFDSPVIGPAPDIGFVSRTPSAKVLKAQALERREKLLALLERIAEGGQPSRQDSLDAVLGVIEDAHSADPVLFGPDAVIHFARLNGARSALIF